MISTRINSSCGTYDVIIGSGLLARTGSIVRERLSCRRCAIITDSVVGPAFTKPLQRSLTDNRIESTVVEIPAGEQTKTLAQAGTICDEMLDQNVDRHSCVVGLGGGVVGDISGFVAAIFQRGIPHLQVPTTLLAMVDSSIGGKTGVNTKAGKNLIGALHQPTLVIDDIDSLRTLPDRQFRQGFAEIIKHAVIADAEMFTILEVEEGLTLPAREIAPDKLESLVARNVETKSKIASSDEQDRTGRRALLNFGHTVGHGIERAGDYNVFLHGEAISLGMVAALDISVRRAGLPGEQRDAAVKLLQRFGLPTKLPKNFPRRQILEALKFDKKFEAGEIRFVVTPRIGSACLSKDVTFDDIRAAVEQL